MMKLSKMTDYAVIILADMAQRNNGRDGRLVSATILAEATKLPEPTVSKILKALARHDIVASTRGMNGGYTLGRKPEEINMAHIITATDGPIALTACVDQNMECCERASSCSMKGQWNPVNTAMQNALANVSLQQMIGVVR
jgi:FeS assembly SUF system regulator